MEKPKLPLNELIHEGATVCFDWVDYLDETPPDLTFGLNQDLWEKDKFEEVQKYHIDAVNYIKLNNLKSDDFGYDFKEEYLENKHYLILSFFGNKIDEIIFSEMSESQIQKRFSGEDFYYNLEDINLALDFTIKKLETITKKK